nr:MAG: hypothetical protein DIU78_19990 [Pseudomonadota bacterium]
MPRRKKAAPSGASSAASTRKRSAGSTSVDDVLGWLRENASPRTREGLTRFGIPNANAFGVTVAELRAYAKQLGKDHALADALWSPVGTKRACSSSRDA